MSWSTPKTWVAGAVLPASDLNTHVRDQLNLLKTSIADDGSVFGPLQGYREKQQTVAIAAGVVTVNPLLGSHVEVNMTANITSFVISNVPVTGLVYPVIFHFKGDGTPRTITWSVNSKTVKFSSNAPLSPTTGTVNKYDEVSIQTRDGDTSWEGGIHKLNV